MGKPTPPLLNYPTWPPGTDPNLAREINHLVFELNRVLRNNTGFQPGQSTGTGYVLGINAHTLDGWTLQQILNNATNQGTMRGLLPFFDRLSGFVIKGRPNSTAWRLAIDDSTWDPADVNSTPVTYLEAQGAARVEDRSFSTSAAGPVLMGRFLAGVYRFAVDDSETASPKLGIERLATTANVTPADFLFGQNFSWINRGRAKGLSWLWFVDDSQGLDAAVIGVDRWQY